jgi:ketosteroid isomerase-like protein
MGNTKLVQQALAALREGAIERARDVVADDFIWHIPGASPISGDANGVEEWAGKLKRLIGAGLTPQVQAMLDGPEHVAVLQRNTAEAKGHSLDVRVVNLFTVRDGKIARLDTFFSDQTAADDFWSAALRL